MLFINNILKPILNNINNHSDRNAFYILEKYYTYRDLGVEINKIRFHLKLIKEKFLD